ncbi:MAG: hypothetical protein JWO35_514 [Candidatus Saccharibacteria bacterium]|nr:hypothetical protein [Candidatus Saccharibacteria bacterium]
MPAIVHLINVYGASENLGYVYPDQTEPFVFKDTYGGAIRTLLVKCMSQDVGVRIFEYDSERDPENIGSEAIPIHNLGEQHEVHNIQEDGQFTTDPIIEARYGECQILVDHIDSMTPN